MKNPRIRIVSVGGFSCLIEQPFEVDATLDHMFCGLMYHYVLQSKYCAFCNAFRDSVLKIALANSPAERVLPQVDKYLTRECASLAERFLSYRTQFPIR